MRRWPPRADLDDFLNHVAVLVAHIAGVHLHMVVAGDCGELNLNVAGGQLQEPQSFFICFL